MIQEYDENQQLVKYTTWLTQKGYITEGINASRLVANFILRKDKCDVNVDNRPHVVKMLSKLNCQLGTLEKQMELLLQEREEMLNQLREIDDKISMEVDEDGN